MNTAETPLLEIAGLFKRFGRFEAVRDLTFSVSGGEIVGLLGPNGAGKTTTIRCIASLLRPTAGRVRIGGFDLETSPEDAKRALAYVPEVPNPYEMLTVWEHLRFIAAAYGAEGEMVRAEAVLKRLDLWEKRGELGANLSKGMKQKLACACAFVHRARVFCFDEPLIGLDPKGARELKEMLRESRDAGAARTGPPVSVLLRLALWQLKNALRDALTNPRKLIPIILVALITAGSGYAVLHPPAGTANPISLLPDFLRANQAAMHAVIFLLLSLFMVATLDRGFVGGTLRYSASDTDYLFLAPFPSRLVLGFRLLAPAPGLLLAILYNMFFPPHGPALSALPAWTATAALFACVGGYQNLSVALDLVYGLGRSVLLRRFYLGAVALLVAYAVFLSRRYGVAGLTDHAEHGPLPVLFYPCRLVADVALAASAGRGWLAGGQLALFYLLSLVLVFAPSVNFHEAAAGATERVAQAQQALSDGQ